MKNQIRKNHIALKASGLARVHKAAVASLRPVNYELSTAPALPEILFLTSYPPRECGIATYSQDLVKALNNKFNRSFTINICPLESGNEKHQYTNEIKYILNTDHADEFTRLAVDINDNANIQLVLIQHEFGLFNKNGDDLQVFLKLLVKPVVIVFHTVLPRPQESLKIKVQQLAGAAESLIVMTNSSAKILTEEYAISPGKITVIPHGTHLVPHADREVLKAKYNISGKKVLSTFGLLGSGKSIETTLDALPAIVKKNPDVLFLIIGKTHPSVIKHEGEKYREMLEAKVAALELADNVQFINSFLPLPDLLEYLQLTDIYLFTSRDPDQAVSGTFSYAISCGCPIISTPIPHAREVLQNDTGIIIDFGNPVQLTEAVNKLLNDEQLRKNISSNGLHRMASTAWENAAIAHALLFKKMQHVRLTLQYKVPAININHVKKLTTGFGMIQFSKINEPDIDSGYTLDDNARALVAMCQHFELTRDEADIKYIKIYLRFIEHCLHNESYFLNYVDEQKIFTEQNDLTNLADANGRAIWALGYLVYISDSLPSSCLSIATDAASLMQTALQHVHTIHSTRAMAFMIKGLYYSNKKNSSVKYVSLIKEFSNRLVQMYRHEANNDWQWFESYLTYANSILPEALLCAWFATGLPVYRSIARSSFDFLLSKTFMNDSIKVISNQGWLHKGSDALRTVNGGEQPIDVAYTILALHKFHEAFPGEDYMHKLVNSFNWFLGDNHLHQVIYNPCTGGCYDGLEKDYINLNQGAESTVSYLMARLTLEEILQQQQNKVPDLRLNKTAPSVNLLATAYSHIA